MKAEVPNHEPSLMLMNCGDAVQSRPSLGAWTTYGLGTENSNLPGFIVMCPGGYPIKDADNWQSGFLPGVYQGTFLDSQHTKIEKLIENIRNSRTSLTEQRAATGSGPAAQRGTSVGAATRRATGGADSVHGNGLPDADGGG